MDPIETKTKKLLELPVDLLARITRVAKANRRSANAEIVVAVERYVAAEDPTREDSHDRKEGVSDPLRRP